MTCRKKKKQFPKDKKNYKVKFQDNSLLKEKKFEKQQKKKVSNQSKLAWKTRNLSRKICQSSYKVNIKK
jgi:outer membrane protein assembly factor BamE (lipoprotein component of BamABCDE complex)